MGLEGGGSDSHSSTGQLFRLECELFLREEAILDPLVELLEFLYIFEALLVLPSVCLLIFLHSDLLFKVLVRRALKHFLETLEVLPRNLRLLLMHRN